MCYVRNDSKDGAQGINRFQADIHFVERVKLLKKYRGNEKKRKGNKLIIEYKTKSSKMCRYEFWRDFTERRWKRRRLAERQ